MPLGLVLGQSGPVGRAASVMNSVPIVPTPAEVSQLMDDARQSRRPEHDGRGSLLSTMSFWSCWRIVWPTLRNKRTPWVSNSSTIHSCSLTPVCQGGVRHLR